LLTKFKTSYAQVVEVKRRRRKTSTTRYKNACRSTVEERETATLKTKTKNYRKREITPEETFSYNSCRLRS
jgi:hypothetical protein